MHDDTSRFHHSCQVNQSGRELIGESRERAVLIVRSIICNEVEQKGIGISAPVAIKSFAKVLSVFSLHRQLC